jgi:hypothetical protein
MTRCGFPLLAAFAIPAILFALSAAPCAGAQAVKPKE